jgi:hypothetical protein
LKKFLLPAICLLIASCSSQNPWLLDEISAGDSAFNSSRLSYADTSAPLQFELIRLGNEVEAYLALPRGRLAPSTPEGPSVLALFEIEGEKIETAIPLREGAMRVRLPHSIAAQITEALQDGKKVGILLDDFAVSLEPGLFAKRFSQFLGKRFKEETLFTGPPQ